MATSRPAQTELVRVLGIIFGLAAVVGGMVGQGILRTPGIVAAAIPDAGFIILMWVLTGVFAGLCAMAYAEIATACPSAGGPYAFARRGLGKSAGVAVGWADWLNNLAGQAFVCVVLAEFLHRLGLLTSLSVNVIAPLALVIFFLINSTGTRTCGATQVVGSTLKALGLLALIGILLLSKGRMGAPPPAGHPASAVIGIGALSVAFRAIQVTYNGWNSPTYFCEEVTAPERNIPRTLFGGIAMVTFLYVMVNVALLHVLSPAQMAGSKLAVADALRVVEGPWADTTMTLFGVLSLAAIANLQLMYSTRTSFAMARDRVLPAALAKVLPNGTPRNALIVTTIIAALLSASGTYEQLIAFAVAGQLFADLAVSLTVIRLRYTEPDMPRPWRAPFYPWTVGTGALLQCFLLIALIKHDSIHSLAGISVAVVMGVAYALRQRFVQAKAVPA